MKEYLNFERFLTPRLIQIVFWIGVGVSVARGIVWFADPFHNSFHRIVLGFVWLFVGPIIVRVLCEVIMAIFSMAGRDTE